jgi:predicted ATPase
MVTRRPTSPLFVGRREEIARLGDALSRAGAGESSLVLVGGEAGVGKSRFVAEFAARAEAAGARVLADIVGGLAYAPFSEALRRLDLELGSIDREAILARTTPELASLVRAWAIEPADPDVAARDPDERRARLYESVLAVLAFLAAERPLVLIIEDLHWADSSTRDLLRFLHRNLVGDRVVLVTTYRSDDLHRRHPTAPLLAELERSDHVERVTIEPFGRDDVAELLDAILGEWRGDARFAGEPPRDPREPARPTHGSGARDRPRSQRARNQVPARSARRRA